MNDSLYSGRPFDLDKDCLNASIHDLHQSTWEPVNHSTTLAFYGQSLKNRCKDATFWAKITKISASIFVSLLAQHCSDRQQHWVFLSLIVRKRRKIVPLPQCICCKEYKKQLRQMSSGWLIWVYFRTKFCTIYWYRVTR